jgi:hypothetical protein
MSNDRRKLPLNERTLMLEADVSRLQADNGGILDELKLLRGIVQAMERKIWMAIGAVGAVTWLIQLFKH